MEPKKPRQNRDLYNLRYQDLTDLTASWGFTPYHADKIWRELYVKNITSIGQMGKLRSDLLARLEQGTEIRLPAELASLQSSDGQTVKYLLSLGDGESIETVLMRFDGRTTACISTQVGCAIGCVFCATGQMGFVRNLSLGEIVSQVIFIKRKLKEEDRELRNVVFMGMGEPLNNYKATLTLSTYLRMTADWPLDLVILRSARSVCRSPFEGWLTTKGRLILRLACTQRQRGSERRWCRSAAAGRLTN